VTRDGVASGRLAGAGQTVEAASWPPFLMGVDVLSRSSQPAVGVKPMQDRICSTATKLSEPQQLKSVPVAGRICEQNLQKAARLLGEALRHRLILHSYVE
jgi:hypothetical protein